MLTPALPQWLWDVLINQSKLLNSCSNVGERCVSKQPHEQGQTLAAIGRGQFSRRLTNKFGKKYTSRTFALSVNFDSHVSKHENRKEHWTNYKIQIRDIRKNQDRLIGRDIQTRPTG